MEDPLLNRDLGEVKELQTRWNQYRDFVTMAMRQQPISAQAEMKFLELKSRIAMLHDSFMNSLQHDQQTGQNMMNIVNDMILLKKAARATDAEKQKFEFDWNECYLLISETVSGMDEEVKRLAGINERSYRAAQRRDLIKTRIHHFFHSSAVHFLIGLIVVIGGIWAAQTFWGFENLHKNRGTRPVYNWIVTVAWRPYINQDYAYHEWNDIPINEDYIVGYDLEKNPLPVEQKAAAELTYDTFVTQELKPLGMGHTEFSEMKKLLDARGEFLTDRLSANGVDVRYFFILMKTTAEAKKLVEFWTNSYKNNLNEEQQKFIKDNYYVYRKANAIFIGISTQIYRKDHIQFRYELEDSESQTVFATAVGP